MNKFKSIFKEEFEIFIKAKQNEGLKYHSEEYKLLMIDDILFKNNVKENRYSYI